MSSKHKKAELTQNLHGGDDQKHSIAFEGVVTVDEVFRAAALATPPGNKIATWVVRVYFVSALVYFAWLTLFCWSRGEKNMARIALAGTVLLFFFVGLGFFRILRQRQSIKSLAANSQGIFAEPIGEVDHQAIWSRSNDSDFELKWTSFRGYRQSEDIVLLFFHDSANYALMSGSKFSNDDDWNKFVEIIKEKLQET